MANIDDIRRLGELAARATFTREGAKVITRVQGDDGSAALELLTAMRDELLAAHAEIQRRDAEDATAEDNDAEDETAGGEA